MHELPVIQKILDVCLKHAKMNNVKRIVGIQLKVGEMSDLEPEWMQRYFDFTSKDTIAKGAKLEIEKIPVSFRCNSCDESFSVNIRKTEDIACPACGEGGKGLKLISGREYYIGNMEVI